MITEIQSFVCQECGEIFSASPMENAVCRKCMSCHILCPPCKFVHEMSAAKQDYYLNGLESDPEFYGK